MRLITTQILLPGGWRYDQKDSNNRLLKQFKSYNPWPEFVGEITDFRKANGLAGATVHEVDLDAQEFMCREVGGDPKWCQSKKNPSSGWTSPLGRLARAAGHAANSAAKLAGGLGVLALWVGGGKEPVPTPEAQDRADICLGTGNGHPCPHNRADADFGALTGPAAQFIRDQMSEKYQRHLAVKGEESLHHCAICLCHLPLKVFTPKETIRDRTPSSMWNKFVEQAPANCWMLALKP
jgi:hypothetical protein